jgi:hypothetical protein
METPEKFLNWLEGYLDASDNTLSTKQVRDIRKKISAVNAASTINYQPTTFSLVQPDSRMTTSSEPIVPIYDSAISTSTHTVKNIPLSETIDEDFLAAIEKNKNVSSIEELFDEQN